MELAATIKLQTEGQTSFTSHVRSDCEVPMLSVSCTLEEGFELGSREDGLGLLQSLDFLIASGLADLEILEYKVTALVELSLVVCKLLELQHHSLFVLLGFNQVGLRLCLGLRLVYDIF